MFVLAKRNIVLPTADYSERFMLRKDEFVTVPDQFTQTAYFAGLVNDGKIVVPESRKDKDVETANAVAEDVLAAVTEDQQTDPAEKAKKHGRKPKK